MEHHLNCKIQCFYAQGFSHPPPAREQHHSYLAIPASIDKPLLLQCYHCQTKSYTTTRTCCFCRDQLSGTVGTCSLDPHQPSQLRSNQVSGKMSHRHTCQCSSSPLPIWLSGPTFWLSTVHSIMLQLRTCKRWPAVWPPRERWPLVPHFLLHHHRPSSEVLASICHHWRPRLSYKWT